MLKHLRNTHSKQQAKPGNSKLYSFIQFNVRQPFFSAELASQTNMVGKAKQRVEQIEEQLNQAR